MYISVNGRIAKKKQVEIFIFDVMKHLMPRLKRNVSIDVNIVTRCDNQHYALCLGDKDSAEIELARGSGNKTFTLKEIMLNLAHELVHAKQFVRGELHSNLNKWKSLDYSNTAYSRQPWEKEAYLLEDELLEKYWNKNGKINNKKK
jgi:hypothetical protein|tara:strand:- start:1243 stop:1680 length:438 start_codon:yes stop_codon:yes gene_type:complete